MNVLTKSAPSILLILLLTIVVLGCQQKATVETVSDVVSEKVDDEMAYTQKGYIEATVTFDETAPNGCQFILMTVRGERLESLDFPKELRIADKPIWIKFNRQRRPGRCAGAQPIEILEIVDREVK